MTDNAHAEHLRLLALRLPKSRAIAAFIDAEQVVYRSIAQALIEAHAEHWDALAEEFEAAAHREGDYPGLATEQELKQQVTRCLETARACRNKAAVIRMQDAQVTPALIADLHREAA
jgi:hypothetical protein